jgi:hypothetical protein
VQAGLSLARAAMAAASLDINASNSSRLPQPSTDIMTAACTLLCPKSLALALMLSCSPTPGTLANPTLAGCAATDTDQQAIRESHSVNEEMKYLCCACLSACYVQMSCYNYATGALPSASPAQFVAVALHLTDTAHATLWHALVACLAAMIHAGALAQLHQCLPTLVTAIQVAMAQCTSAVNAAEAVQKSHASAQSDMPQSVGMQLEHDFSSLSGPLLVRSLSRSRYLASVHAIDSVSICIAVCVHTPCSECAQVACSAMPSHACSAMPSQTAGAVHHRV